MEDPWAAYAAALSLGAAHALEVDHMVAVSAFIGGKPQLRFAVAFGVRWGVGHALVVMLAGGLLVWMGVSLSQSAEVWAELGVGVVLVAVGLWALRMSCQLHVHDPHGHGGHGHLRAHPQDQHPHFHAHTNPLKRHRHLSTLVGAVHGLAGTVPVVALIPVTLFSDLGFALGYLATFGGGTILAMSLYAALAALAISKATSSIAVARAFALVTALASAVVGVWWIARAATQLTA